MKHEIPSCLSTRSSKFAWETIVKSKIRFQRCRWTLKVAIIQGKQRTENPLVSFRRKHRNFPLPSTCFVPSKILSSRRGNCRANATDSDFARPRRSIARRWHNSATPIQFDENSATFSARVMIDLTFCPVYDDSNEEFQEFYRRWFAVERARHKGLLDCQNFQLEVR